MSVKLNQNIMADVQKTPIRSLERITVVVDEATFNLSLRFDVRKSVEDNLSRLEGEFLRKLRNVSQNSFFSIEGDADTLDEAPEQIFVETVVNPYINDDPYPLIDRLGTGLLPLGPARSAHVNNRPAQGRGSRNASNTVTAPGSRHKSSYV